MKTKEDIIKEVTEAKGAEIKLSLNGWVAVADIMDKWAEHENAALKDHHENLQYKVQIEHHAELDTLKALVEKAFLAGRSKTSWEQFKKENAETLK